MESTSVGTKVKGGIKAKQTKQPKLRRTNTGEQKRLLCMTELSADN